MNSTNALPDRHSPTRIERSSSVRFRIVLFTTVSLLVITSLAALCLGPVHLSIPTVMHQLINPGRPVEYSKDWTINNIVWTIRFPRVVLASLIGIALAASGAGFQSLLRNDLADPYILGISSGASAAVAAVSLVGALSSALGYAEPLAALAGAAVVLFTVLGLSTRNGRIDSRSLILNGVIVSAFLSALEMAALRLAGHNYEDILNWLMGSLGNANWSMCAITAVVSIVGVTLLVLLAPSMNLYAIGEDSARQLGLNADRFKLLVIGASTALAAIAVSMVGIIGFIGLISPHIARLLLKTPDHRLTVPLATIIGAALLLWSDTFARVLLGGDILPVGILTAFLGAPFFCYQLRRK